jgi:hypothetical protein
MKMTLCWLSSQMVSSVMTVQKLMQLINLLRLRKMVLCIEFKAHMVKHHKLLNKISCKLQILTVVNHS